MTRWTPRLRPLTPESGELLHLDLLRFVAAVGIVAVHSIEFFWPAGARDIPHRLTSGLPLFVDVFFVISGFVIAFVYGDRIRSPSDYGMFLQRRVGRLFPLHLLTMAIAILLAVLIAKSGVTMAHPADLSLACISSNALLLHAMLPCQGYPISGITWSLSAEMAMYALFPVFLWLSGRSLVRTAFLVAAAFGGVLLVYGTQVPWQAHLSVGRALPAFLLGILFFFARDTLARVPVPRVVLIAGTLLFMVGEPLGFPTFVLVALAYLIPAFAVAADRQGGTPKWVRRSAPLGQLTYSLYMIHGLLALVILNAIGDKLLRLSPLPMLMLGLATYALLFVLAKASFQLFETPMRRWIDRLPIFARRSSRTFRTSKGPMSGEQGTSRV
jgi:peptidoglycan/LPS O-acetylase OafA/YrhL